MIWIRILTFVPMKGLRFFNVTGFYYCSGSYLKIISYLKLPLPNTEGVPLHLEN